MNGRKEKKDKVWRRTMTFPLTFKEDKFLALDVTAFLKEQNKIKHAMSWAKCQIHSNYVRSFSFPKMGYLLVCSIIYIEANQDNNTDNVP